MNYLKKNNLTVLIVTYSDRRKYLKESLNSLKLFGNCLKNIVLVQNGVDYDLLSFLKKEISLPLKIFHLIINKENTGSSGGFGNGIEEAKSLNGDFLFILDDDNIVPKQSIDNLQELSLKSLERDYDSRIAISFYRPQHDQDPLKFKRNFDFINKSYVKNTIANFSISHKFFKERYFQKRIDPKKAELFFAPYSGLLIEKELLKLVPPVFKDFYLYGDDTRLTSQLSYAGVKIISIECIFTKDLEQSWYQNKTKIEQQKNSIELFLTSENRQKIWRPFYNLRNDVYNSKTLHKKGNFIFYINLFLLISIPFFIYLPKNKNVLKNYRYYLKAIKDGYFGKLGRINEKLFK
ncbi:glycosyltransferase family 2 protein [Oenococcus oeni]